MSSRTGIIIIVVLVLTIIVGGGIGFFYIKNKSDTPKEVEKFVHTTEDMFCNIKNSPRIAKVRISVASTSEKSIEKIKDNEYIIRDTSNKIIRNREEDDLEGEEGQNSLRETIKQELENAFPNDEITDIYFDDFVIQ